MKPPISPKKELQEPQPTETMSQVADRIQQKAIEPVLAGKEVERPPLLFEVFDHLPYLRRLPAMAIGLGVRPEHIHTPEVLT